MQEINGIRKKTRAHAIMARFSKQVIASTGRHVFASSDLLVTVLAKPFFEIGFVISSPLT